MTESSRNRCPFLPAAKHQSEIIPIALIGQTNNHWIYMWNVNASPWIRQNLFHQMTVNLPEIGAQRRPPSAYCQAPKWDNPSYYEAIKSGHFKLLAKCNSCAKKTRLENTCTVIGFFPKSVREKILFLWFPICCSFSKYVEQSLYIWTVKF